MTIILPNKNNKSNLLVFILMTAGVLSVVWGVFLYNELVDLRHEFQRQNDDIQKAEVSNAELKNNLYNIIDARNLEALVEGQYLVLDNDPQYIKSMDSKQFTVNN